MFFQQYSTQASRTVLKRAKLKFVSTDAKSLPVDCGEVTLVSYDSASNGERNQGKNGTSKAVAEKPISAIQLSLQLY
jgi:hypothetical protein